MLNYIIKLEDIQNLPNNSYEIVCTNSSTRHSLKEENFDQIKTLKECKLYLQKLKFQQDTCTCVPKDD